MKKKSKCSNPRCRNCNPGKIFKCTNCRNDILGDRVILRNYYDVDIISKISKKLGIDIAEYPEIYLDIQGTANIGGIVEREIIKNFTIKHDLCLECEKEMETPDGYFLDTNFIKYMEHILNQAKMEVN